MIDSTDEYSLDIFSDDKNQKALLEAYTSADTDGRQQLFGLVMTELLEAKSVLNQSP